MVRLENYDMSWKHGRNAMLSWQHGRKNQMTEYYDQGLQAA